jgi:hypothetical protein
MSTNSLGSELCDDTTPPPPISMEISNEQEVAAAVARLVDAMSQLTKFLPLPPEAAHKFRSSVYLAWTQLLHDSQICGDDGVLEDNEDG